MDDFFAKDVFRMDGNLFFKHYGSQVAFRDDRYGKSTLFENGSMLVGLNCLNPGQVFEKHAHEMQTRFFVVLEGKGPVWVGEEKQECGPGTVIWIPPEHTHRIENTGEVPMVLLVGITPNHED